MRKTLIAAACITAVACSQTPASDPRADGRISVVATVSPITNLVENIGGEHVRVTGLVPEGVNSHTFEPTPSDARLLAEADLFFANGLNLELPSISLAEQNLPEDASIVELAPQTITEDEWIFDFSFPEEEGDPNPHLWTNPPYAKRYAQIISESLAEADPDNADAYRANYAEIAARLDALSEALIDATATVPPGSRKLLTYHDSFPYMARDYGWTVIGAVQPSDFSEPTPREIANLITQIREARIPAIFGSEVFPSPVLEQIARETGAQYVDDLRDDDLPGAPGDDDHSLIGLLVFDFKTMVEALGGDASALDSVDISNLPGGGEAIYRQ
ncbi:MAG: metal ABC transporter substrate-binding protein [Actinomycetota bacterium]